MDPYTDALMEELIDYTTEESGDITHSSWTEQALDLFMSILKNVKKGNFSNLHEMLEVIALKMSKRNYHFNVDQLEKKYNSLRKMYKDKKDKNQTVEQELINLFGDVNDRTFVAVQKVHQPPLKKAKVDSTVDITLNLDTTPEDSEDKKAFWSPEATKNFLNLLEQTRPQLGAKLRTKKQMWEEICKRLNDLGFAYTPPQVENKWKALLRHYRGRLELLRKGNNQGSSSNLKNDYSAWPELFELSADSQISFANDQSLPYDDDGYTIDEPFEFEETCTTPDAELNQDEIDPVLTDDVKQTAQQPKDKPSSSMAPPFPVDHTLSQLDEILRVMESFREDSQKHQQDVIVVKKMKLQAYKERTKQFTRIADGIGDLMSYLKRKASD